MSDIDRDRKGLRIAEDLAGVVQATCAELLDPYVGKALALHLARYWTNCARC